MSFTSEDRLKEALLPMVRAINPARQLRRDRAVARAISDDGYVQERALLATSPRVLIDFDAVSHTASSSDTVAYAEYASTVIVLPGGVWRLKARGELSGRLSGSSNLNSQLWLNGDAGGNRQIPLAAGDMATVWPNHELAEAQGEVLLQVLYRPSGGSATIEAGGWMYRAERIG